MPFKVDGRLVAQGGVSPVRIVQPFQVVEDRPLGFGRGGKSLTIQQLGLEGGEEALAQSVVVAIPTVPIDGRTPASRQRCPKARAVYWLP